MKKPAAPTLFGVSYAARKLGLSETHVGHLVNMGRLTCIRDTSGKRLFTDDDLDAYRALPPVPRGRPRLAARA